MNTRRLETRALWTLAIAIFIAAAVYIGGRVWQFASIFL